MHPDATRLQSYADGELPPVERDSIRRHIAACASCGAIIEATQHERDAIEELLRVIDHPHQPVSVDRVRARARQQYGSRRGMLRAAGIVLAVVAAGVAYAAPGSPVREWIDGIQRIRPAAPPTRQAPQSDVPASMAGIAVRPGPSLVIRFVEAQASGSVRVSLVDSSTVVVRAPQAAATYATADELLLIDNSGSTASFDIEIPRNARNVELWVAAEQLVTVRNGRFSTAGAAGVAQVELPLARPSRSGVKPNR